jgi:hypothetical protein
MCLRADNWIHGTWAPLACELCWLAAASCGLVPVSADSEN